MYSIFYNVISELYLAEFIIVRVQKYRFSSDILVRQTIWLNVDQPLCVNALFYNTIQDYNKAIVATMNHCLQGFNKGDRNG